MERGYYSIDYIETLQGIEIYQLIFENRIYKIKRLSNGLEVNPFPSDFLAEAIQKAFQESNAVGKYDLGFVIR